MGPDQMNSICDVTQAAVNAFLATLDKNNVINIENYVAPAGKYGEWMFYRSVVTYLEDI